MLTHRRMTSHARIRSRVILVTLLLLLGAALAARWLLFWGARMGRRSTAASAVVEAASLSDLRAPRRSNAVAPRVFTSSAPSGAPIVPQGEVNFTTTCTELGRQRLASFRSSGGNPVFDSGAVAHHYLLSKVPDSLLEQLADYRRRALKKLETRNSRMWKRYFQQPWDVAKCLDFTPECSLLLRPDVFPDAYASSPGVVEMFADAHTQVVAGQPLDEVEISRLMHSVLAPVNATTSNFLLRKCCFEHRELRRALEAVFGTTNTYFGNVTLWLTAGTLLGAFREQGVLIPWDTDADLLVSPEQAANVEHSLLKLSNLYRSDTSKDGKHPEDFAAKLEHPAVAILNKEHAHGKLLGVIYGTHRYFHDESSRIEIWVRDETKKMQRKAINEPVVRCSLYGMSMWCPSDPIAVLHAGYGPTWCFPCKHKTSNCKGVFNTTAIAHIQAR